MIGDNGRLYDPQTGLTHEGLRVFDPRLGEMPVGPCYVMPCGHAMSTVVPGITSIRTHPAWDGCCLWCVEAEARVRQPGWYAARPEKAN